MGVAVGERCPGTIRIREQKNRKDIGHEENIVKWSNERLEEVEWTTTSKAKEGSSGNKLQIWRRGTIWW